MEIKEIMIYCFTRVARDDSLRERLVQSIIEDENVKRIFIEALSKIAEDVKRLENARSADKDVDTEFSDDEDKNG